MRAKPPGDVATGAKVDGRAPRWSVSEWLVVAASALNALFATLSLPTILLAPLRGDHDLWSKEWFSSGWLGLLALSVVGSLVATLQGRWEILQRVVVGAALMELVWLVCVVAQTAGT